jgi:hypothetical protein
MQVWPPSVIINGDQMNEGASQSWRDQPVEARPR